LGHRAQLLWNASLDTSLNLRWLISCGGGCNSQRALGSTSRGVADIAEEVGYESEAAFNRAFKREFGSPPARYRRDQRAAKI